jgi:hypothetical protein
LELEDEVGLASPMSLQWLVVIIRVFVGAFEENVPD